MSNTTDNKVSDINAKFEGRLAEIIEAAQNPMAEVAPLRAAIGLYTDALEWNRRGGGYEGWLEMVKNYFYHPELMALDQSGKLRELADAYFKEDLRVYFDLYVGMEPRDVETLALKRRLLDERLDELLGH